MTDSQPTSTAAGLSGLKAWLFATFAPELTARPDAAPAAFRESAGVTIDADEDQWRPLTGDVNRDLSPMTQQRMQKMAAYLWEANLLANRLIELPLAYILGEGVKLKCDDEDLQKVIDAFWADPVNEMDLKLPKKVRELALFGEQCWPAFVNEHNGHVRLGYLDPSLIATVVKDPDNGEQIIGVVTAKDKHGKGRRFKTIVNADDAEVFTQRTLAIRETFTDGQCFFFQINDLSSGNRGRSDLLAQADWLDTYEQFMFGEADRAVSLRSFIWDITLKGATPDEVAKRAKEITSPRPGSVRVHNDSEEWKAEAPTLGGNDLSEVAKLFRNHILGGATIPTIWYGGSQDANRAVGGEMAEATVKTLTQRQNVWKHILVFVARYAIRQHALIGQSGKIDWKKINLRAEFPEIQARDTTKYAAAMQQVTSAVVIAIERGLVTEELGLSMIEKIAGQLGVQFDAADEIAKARAEKKKRDDERDAARGSIEDIPPLPGDETGRDEPPAPGEDASAMKEAIADAAQDTGRAIAALRDRVDSLVSVMAAQAAMREAAPAPVIIPEGAIKIDVHNHVPAPIATETRVTGRDEDGRITSKRDDHIYEDK